MLRKMTALYFLMFACQNLHNQNAGQLYNEYNDDWGSGPVPKTTTGFTRELIQTWSKDLPKHFIIIQFNTTYHSIIEQAMKYLEIGNPIPLTTLNQSMAFESGRSWYLFRADNGPMVEVAHLPGVFVRFTATRDRGECVASEQRRG